MDRIVRALLIAVGVFFLTVSVVGLSNSALNSREVLVSALGAAGMVLTLIGLREWFPVIGVAR